MKLSQQPERLFQQWSRVWRSSRDSNLQAYNHRIMHDEPSLVDRGSAIMDFRKKMMPVFSDPEGSRKAKADFENKLKRGKKRATEKFLKTIKDDDK